MPGQTPGIPVKRLRSRPSRPESSQKAEKNRERTQVRSFSYADIDKIMKIRYSDMFLNVKKRGVDKSD